MRYRRINILPERVILIFLFLILPHQAIAVDFNTKSLICHTKQFPVKGGFKFVNKQELIKYNILYDTSIKSEYLFSSKHCYKVIKNEIIISEYSLSNYCGSYVSSIDIGSLIYSIPTEKGFLTADCEFFDGTLENKLKSSLNVTIN